MVYRVIAATVLAAGLLSGCISQATHSQTLAELEEARKAAAQTASALDSFKKQAAADAARLRQEHEQRVEELNKLKATLKEQEAQLAAKDQDIQRLSKAQADLTKSLEAEIAKGNVRVQQLRDRLTINILEKVLFDSGQSEIKPAGLAVLQQVSDVLKAVTDKQIRIEGHTDNVPISARLRPRYPTNWELSTARATSVVRYLVERGGVDRTNLSAVGYADTRPVASSDTEEGRKANRRIEILLAPKDLSEIAKDMAP